MRTKNVKCSCGSDHIKYYFEHYKYYSIFNILHSYRHSYFLHKLKDIFKILLGKSIEIDIILDDNERSKEWVKSLCEELQRRISNEAHYRKKQKTQR
jgi:hypothetical protein